MYDFEPGNVRCWTRNTQKTGILAGFTIHEKKKILIFNEISGHFKRYSINFGFKVNF